MVGRRRGLRSSSVSVALPFRSRYSELENRRLTLLARLAMLEATRGPGYSNAKKLLNQHFRAASLAQRAAILDSADWLIEVLIRGGSLI
jgi:hypothetical protein